MEFELPLPSEFRMPNDELIRKPYSVPDWWDKEVKWRSSQPKPQGPKNGRPPKGVLSVRDQVSQALQEKPWQTVKELCEIVDSQRKGISYLLSTGVHNGIFIRRVRTGHEFEYKHAEVS